MGRVRDVVVLNYQDTVQDTVASYDEDLTMVHLKSLPVLNYYRSCRNTNNFNLYAGSKTYDPGMPGMVVNSDRTKTFSRVNQGWCLFDELPTTVQRQISNAITSRTTALQDSGLQHYVAPEDYFLKDRSRRKENDWVIRVWGHDNDEREMGRNRGRSSYKNAEKGCNGRMLYENEEELYYPYNDEQNYFNHPSYINTMSNYERRKHNTMSISSSQHLIYGMAKHYESMYSPIDTRKKGEGNSLYSEVTKQENDDSDEKTDEDVITAEDNRTYRSAIVSFISSYLSTGLSKLYNVLPLRSRNNRSV